jgi:sialic acid synthase SpsE
MLVVLRPCPESALPPSALPLVVGRTLARDLEKEEALRWGHLV